MQILPLVDKGIIIIQGKDALNFLQGQLTCDVRTLKPHTSQLGALCNQKGRVLANFYLSLKNTEKTDYWMELPKTMVPIILPVLNKYAQFSAVNIQEKTNQTLEQFSLLEKIRTGIATIFPETSTQFTPHDLAYPEIGAVSFNKGCYTGQEIIARMHYRGRLKQHLYHIKFKANENLLPSIHIINSVKLNEDWIEALVVSPDEVIAASHALTLIRRVDNLSSG